MRTTKTITTMKARARRYDAGMNEGGEGFNPYADALHKAEREQDALEEARGQAEMAARQQEEDAEWTASVTTTRRAAWNAWVKAQRGPVTPAQLTAQQTAQGWSVETLQRQIARHGL